MLTIEIPDFPPLQLEHLVLDYNGTLAADGRMLDGVRERLVQLSASLQLHVVTGDTFGTAREALQGLPCNVTRLGESGQRELKRHYINALTPTRVVCVGNGRNDHDMMTVAALAIAVVQLEGASAETLMAAHVVARGICDALDLLLQPKRLVATLRG